MKSLIKHLMLNTSIVSLILFSSSSTAHHSHDMQPLHKNIIPISAKCKFITAPDRLCKCLQFTEASIKQLEINKGSVLAHNIPAMSGYELCQSKGNVLYELIAIFNDKLQLFIAFFSKPQKNQIAKIANKNNSNS